MSFSEIKYLLSLIILKLYKHFKLHDQIEVNNNPFVDFNSEKVEGFEEFANLSLQMDTDLIDEQDLEGVNNLPGLL